MSEEIPLGETYQRAGQIRQMLNERSNCKIFGNTERIKAIDKDLTELGYEGDPEAPVKDDKGPVGRSTRQDHAVTAKVDPPPVPRISSRNG